MRYVPYKPVKLTYPKDWEAKARHASAAVAAASPATRSKVIAQYQPLWKLLKQELARLSHGKCWYTEARQVGTDTDVDHYRPKGSVSGAYRAGTGEQHPGYWWRAFDPANFRFSCIVANRPRRDVASGHKGGKADEFPLWDERKRAWCDTDDCDQEQPLLLDPCNPVDVKLVAFANNGEAIPRYSEAMKAKLFKRAERSIALYHLNHSEFVNERIELRGRIEDLIRQARRLHRRLIDDDPDIEQSYSAVIKQLRAACSEEAPFSSFAISIVEPHRFDESLIGVLD